MRPFSADELLRVWERGRDQHPLDRCLALLGVATSPGKSWEELAALSVGERDRMLLALRQAIFGEHMECVAQCPRCAEELEFAVQASDIQSPGTTPSELGHFELAIDGYEFRFRLPTSRDLVSVAHPGSRQPREPGARRRHLLHLCIVQARRGSESVVLGDLPDAVLARIEQAMADADPQADTVLRLSCAGCGHQWRAVFDIATYLWKELAAQARRLVREIDAIARAYGWTEADILSMSWRRRRTYMEMTS